MGQKFALIIGNSDYQDSALARLAMPEADVKGLAAVLQDPQIGGFDQVSPLVNRSAADLRLEIESFFADKKPDDLLLLYFTGHGVRDDQGQLYLAVNDTKHTRLRATAVPASFVTGEMDRSRSRRQVLILDCCHSGSFAQGSKGVTGESVGTKSAFEGIGYGRVVLTATDATQYAWEGDEVIGEAENSVFTHYVLNGLRTGEADTDNDGRITLDELYDYVYEKVVTVTPKQTPGKWSYRQQGDIVIARNSRPIAKPVPLPTELQQAIESPFSSVREGAVRELERLLQDRHAGLVVSAHEALKRMVDDDSRRLANLVRQILESYEAHLEAQAPQEEEEHRAREQAEAERAAREKAEQELLARERAEAERLAQEKAEQERLAREKAELEDAAKQKVEVERLEREKAEAERLAKEKEEADRLAREQAEQERLVREKAEAERVAREKAEQERIAREKVEAERLEREHREQERLAIEKAEAERRARQKAEQERLAKEKAEAERLAQEKAERERKARERAEQERLTREKVEQEKVTSKPKSVLDMSHALFTPGAQLVEPRPTLRPTRDARSRKPTWPLLVLAGLAAIILIGAIIFAPSSLTTTQPTAVPVVLIVTTPSIAPTATPSATPSATATTALSRTSIPTAPPTATPAKDPIAELRRQLDDAWAKEDWQKASEALDTLRLLQPTNAEVLEKLYAAHVNYGLQLLAAGDVVGAEAQCREALRLNSNGGEALQCLAQLTPTPAPRPTATPTPRTPGLVLDFEDELSWRRGDQPYGTFTRSTEQVKAGAYSNKLAYDFPAVLDNYVVFHPNLPIPLPGRPTGLSAWVYGDGAKHFLNVWIQDTAGERRQYTFGQITHQGWKQMFAPFDEQRGWPNVHISGADNEALDYPVSLQAWILDGVPDGQASRGVIYLDDVYIATQPIVVATATPPPSTDKYDLTLNVKGYEQWGRPSPDSCSDFNNRSPVRKLNVDVTLTNRSPQTVVNWSLEFYNNVGARARVCYFGYENSVSYPTVPPNQNHTLTAAVFTELSQPVAELRATVEGQVLRRCFDGYDGHEIACQ